MSACRTSLVSMPRTAEVSAVRLISALKMVVFFVWRLRSCTMRLPVDVSTVMVLTFVGGGRGTEGADTGAVVGDASVRQYGVLAGVRRIVLHGA